MHEDGFEGSRFKVDVLKFRGEGKHREALVRYYTLFDDIDSTEAESTGRPSLLREWVSSSSIAALPPPPAPLWHRSLRIGDGVDVHYNGGWWQATIRSRLQGNARLKELPRFVVEANGYGLRHTVEVSVGRVLTRAPCFARVLIPQSPASAC